MKLHWGQLQVLSDILVLDFNGFFDGHTLQELSGIGAACDGWPTTKSLKDSLLNSAIFLVHFDLEFHDVTAGGGADEAGSNIGCLLVKWANIARVLIMVNHSLVVSKVASGSHVAHDGERVYLRWAKQESWSLHHSEGEAGRCAQAPLGAHTQKVSIGLHGELFVWKR